MRKTPKVLKEGERVFVNSAHGDSVKMEFREKEMEMLPAALEIRELRAESAAARKK